jgi:hypothetical protein
MDGVLRRLANNLLESCKDLLPIVLVVAFFQIIVLKQAIPEIGVILLGTLSILIGLTFFVSGLRLGLFPIGENLAHSFVNKGSLFWLLLFAFALGFGTTVAEPALLAVSQEAAIVASSGGIIENTELALQAKYGAMREINISENQIKFIKKTDEQMVADWKQMTVTKIVTAFPIKFQNILRFKTWNEAMNFLREQKQNPKKK